MRKKIGCFHAHYSNIEHIEQALRRYEVELIHFVDPGLDRRKADADFTNEAAQKKIKETLDWIANCHVDAILITCTFFTASLQQKDIAAYLIPIIKIDEPLFHDVCGSDKPLIMVFTNPNTVKATMDQLHHVASLRGVELEAESVLLDHTFELIMQGKKEAYIEAVTDGLHQVMQNNPGKTVFAAQLSMGPAAERVNTGHPLQSLATYLAEALQLKRKG
jgi:hypothetical protein